MCKFLCQAVEQNNIFLIALVHPTRPERGWLFGYFRRYMFCKEAFGPSPISLDGRWCRLGASDKEGSSSSWIPASLSSPLLPHRFTYSIDTIVTAGDYFQHYRFLVYSKLLSLLFNNMASRIQILKWAPHIIWSCKDFFLSFDQESIKGGKGIAKEPEIIVTRSPLSSLLSALSPNDYANDLIWYNRQGPKVKWK